MALHHSNGNEKLLEIITYLSNNKHFNPNLGGGRGGKQNIFDSFYEWLLHAMWKGSKKLERWVESEYTCTTDQDHQKMSNIADYCSKFEDIYSMVNPLLINYDT